MSWMASGEIPIPVGPPMASPLSLSKIRPYLGCGFPFMNSSGCEGLVSPALSCNSAGVEGSGEAENLLVVLTLAVLIQVTLFSVAKGTRKWQQQLPPDRQEYKTP